MKEDKNNGKHHSAVYAAIAMALHEELGGVHDVESNVLTIKRRRSAWSAKYDALRVIPRKKEEYQ